MDSEADIANQYLDLEDNFISKKENVLLFQATTKLLNFILIY